MVKNPNIPPRYAFKRSSRNTRESFWRNVVKRIQQSREIDDLQRKKRKKEKTRLDPNRQRYIVRFSPTMLGVIRRFITRDDCRKYIKRVTHTNKKMSNEQFNHLVFIPTQIISFHQNQLVERVYRGPSFLKIIHSSYEGIEENSLYGKVLVRKMLEKKVQYHELEEACRNAYNELVKRLDRRGISQDMNASNFLILDYDPVTKKVDMALIDHWAWNTPPKEQRRE